MTVTVAQALNRRVESVDLLSCIYNRAVVEDEVPEAEIGAAYRLVTMWVTTPSEAVQLIATADANPDIAGEINTAQQLERGISRLRMAIKRKSENEAKFQKPRPYQPYDDANKKRAAAPQVLSLTADQMFLPQPWMSEAGKAQLAKTRERWLRKIKTAESEGHKGPALFRAVLGHEFGKPADAAERLKRAMRGAFEMAKDRASAADSSEPRYVPPIDDVPPETYDDELEDDGDVSF